ncbi:hypothetical protein B7463_g6299, partial [Scytalidium lignicola]
MPPYKEEDVQGAIDVVLHGQSVQGASCDWGIPRTTLMGRIQGLEPRRSSHQLQQILSESQEIQLANWILCQSNIGYASSHTTVRSMVTKLLRLNGLNRTPGKNWMNRFLVCYPEIHTIKGPLNIARPLNSGQVIQPLPEPQTPKKPTHKLEKVGDIDIFTPSHGYQITELVWQIQKHLENSNYTTRLLLQKVSKALDDKNMVLVLKNCRIEELELQLEAIRPSKRLRVPENPNSKFVKIPEIMKAKEELEAKITSWKAKNPELIAVTTSKLVESIPMEQLMFEFQLE